MTSEIFEKWLMSLGVELQRKSRTVLLVLDNCAAHPHLGSLKNIQLEFLSPNTTSLVHLMDVAVTKFEYLISPKVGKSYILEGVQGSLLTSTSAAKEASSRNALLQAAQFIADIWLRVSTKTIQNCFARCDCKTFRIGYAE
jgi:hypothetical protein